ncbi:UPAR/Ly6 domain-containing protein crok-like [Anabrus simplex]|uniref:UPAR/Ly6 domain-containing protein crok-like n=1 Tax=Anabrus simplex TaxID=316456 RepID=UPI0034DD2FEB
MSGAVLVLVLLAALHAGETIRCYVCNSNQDARCADPFLNLSSGIKPVVCGTSPGDTQSIANFIARLGEQPAAPEPPRQPAACQKIDIKVLGRTVTGRGCSQAAMERVHPCDSFKLLATTDLVLEYCGVCETDDCNMAVSFGVVALPLVVLPLVL